MRSRAQESYFSMVQFSFFEGASRRYNYLRGVMFWLCRNRLSGSQVCLRCCSCAYLSLPNAASTPGALVADEVEVGLAGRPRLHRRSYPTYVGDVPLGVCRVRPHREVMHVPGGAPLTECGCIFGYTGDSAATGKEDDLCHRRDGLRCHRSQGVDGLVRQICEEVARPVVLHALWVARVRPLLYRGVRHRLNQVDRRRTELNQRLKHLSPLLDLPRVTHDDSDDRVSPHRLRHEVRWRSGKESHPATNLIWGGLHKVAPEPHDLSRHRGGIHQHAPEHDRAYRIQPEREPGDDAEVAATPAQTPEEVRVLVLGGGHHPPVGRNHLSLKQAVAREAEHPFQPTTATAKSETSDSSRGHAPTRESESV